MLILDQCMGGNQRHAPARGETLTPAYGTASGSAFIGCKRLQISPYKNGKKKLLCIDTRTNKRTNKLSVYSKENENNVFYIF